MNRKMTLSQGALLVLVAGSLGLSGAIANLSAAPAQSTTPTAQTDAPAKAPAKAAAPVRYIPNLSRRAQMYYQGGWGVDELKVKYTESGEMIRFSWRVLDPAKAAALNDKKAAPFLIDPQAQVKLVVPQMEKVGQLRRG